MGIDRDFDRIANDQDSSFDSLEETLHGLAQDLNWQTRTIKLREVLATRDISIEYTGKQNLGRCYNATHFTLTSKEQLSSEFIYYLRDLGLLGYGQEFWFNDAVQQEDGTFVVKAQSRADSSD